jgi:hypothetical protein
LKASVSPRMASGGAGEIVSNIKCVPFQGGRFRPDDEMLR